MTTATTLAITRNGITLTIDATNVVASGAYWDGEPWVQVAPGTTCQVLGWTPALTGTGTTLRNGAMKNCRGNNSHDHGFDGRGTSFSGNLVAAPPVTMAANDVLIVGTSGAGDGANGTIVRSSYLPEQAGRSRIDRMATLTVVSAAPSATDFRPNAIGNPLARQRVTHAQVAWDRLPSVFSSSHPKTPPLADCERIFAPFMGEVVAGWTSDQVTPNWQHPGYGVWMACCVSEALMRACDDSPIAGRQQLVRHLIQKGIDLWGAWRDGRTSGANGGHMMARKALIVFAGHMLGDEAMANPDATLGAGKFRETDAHYRQTGVNAWQGWRQRWAYNRSNASAVAYEDDNPSTWTIGGSNSTQFFESYRGTTIPASVGQGLVMGVIGRAREYGIDAMAALHWHMANHNAAMAAAVPAGFEYWHNAGVRGGPLVRTGKSLRAAAGGYQADQWLTVLPRLLRPAVDYVTPYASEEPLPITFDVPTYGVAFALEVTNAPPDATVATVWIGPLLDASETDVGGWERWVEVSTGVELAGLPNAYGYHRDDVTITAPEKSIAQEVRWGLQVVYELPDTSLVASQPMAIRITPAT